MGSCSNSANENSLRGTTGRSGHGPPQSTWVTVGGTGLVGGEEEVRWQVRWMESHRQEWAGLDSKSRSG